MKIKKIIMNNGNEYDVLWIGNKSEGGFHSLIDLNKGWVKINKAFISETFVVGKLSENTPLKPKIKAIIEKQYGSEVFLE